MKWNQRWKRASLVLLIAAVVVVAGCQAVAGIDFNKMLLNSLKVDSSESKQTLTFKLLKNDTAVEKMGLTAEDKQLLSLLSDITLQIDESKVRDSGHMSMKGTLSLGGKSIDYALLVDGEAALLTVEGAKKPFLLDMTGLTALESMGMGMAGAGWEDEEETKPGDSAPPSEQSMTELGKKLIDHVGGYFIGTMPNPEGLSVDPVVQEEVNGESLALAHVNVKLDAVQVWDWVQSYIEKMAGDREGLHAMIKGLVEIVTADPALMEAFAGTDEFEKPTDEEIDEVVDMVIEELTSAGESMTEAEKEKDFGAIVNKNSYVSADLYVDSKLDIRKTAFEAQFKPDAKVMEDAGVPFDGFVLKMSSETWNVNGDVAVDKIDEKQSVISLESLIDKQGFEVLRMFDPASDAYRLLRSDLHIGKQSVELWMWDDVTPPIVTPSGITLVPLRSVASQLGATVSASGKQITVNDLATGKKITVTKNSNNATVNGKAQKWAYPATVIDGVTYVSARDLAKALGCSIKWLTYEANVKYMFQMEREVA